MFASSYTIKSSFCFVKFINYFIQYIMYTTLYGDMFILVIVLFYQQYLKLFLHGYLKVRAKHQLKAFFIIIIILSYLNKKFSNLTLLSNCKSSFMYILYNTNDNIIEKKITYLFTKNIVLVFSNQLEKKNMMMLSKDNWRFCKILLSIFSLRTMKTGWCHQLIQ